jgi:hypothetical protein
MTLVDWPPASALPAGPGPLNSSWLLRYTGTVDDVCQYSTNCLADFTYNEIDYHSITITAGLDCAGEVMHTNVTLHPLNPDDDEISFDQDVEAGGPVDCNTTFTYSTGGSSITVDFNPDCQHTCCGHCPDGAPLAYCVTLERVTAAECVVVAPDNSAGDKLTTDFAGSYLIPFVASDTDGCVYTAVVKTSGVITTYNGGEGDPCTGDVDDTVPVCLFVFIRVNYTGDGTPGVILWLASADNAYNVYHWPHEDGDTFYDGETITTRPDEPVACDADIKLVTAQSIRAGAFDVTMSPVWSLEGCGDDLGPCVECEDDVDPDYLRVVGCSGDVTTNFVMQQDSAAGVVAFRFADDSDYADDFPGCFQFSPIPTCLTDDLTEIFTSDIETVESCTVCDTECSQDCVACSDCDDICPDEDSAYITLNYNLPAAECGTCDPGGPLGEDGCGRCCQARPPDVGSEVCFNLDEDDCLAGGYFWFCEADCTIGNGVNESPCSNSPRSGTVEIPLVDASAGSMHFHADVSEFSWDVVFNCATKEYTFTITFKDRCVATGTQAGDCDGISGGPIEYELVDTVLGHTCDGGDAGERAHVELDAVVLHRVKTCPA